MHSNEEIKKNLDWKYGIFEKKLGSKLGNFWFIMVHETRKDQDGFPIVNDVPKAMVQEFQKRGWSILNKSEAPVKPKQASKKSA